MTRKAPGKNSEAVRIADQLRRAFTGEAWHGPAVLQLLRGIDAATAAAKPPGNVHSIWELVLHIAAWDNAVRRRLGGTKLRLTALENFPPIPTPSESNWREAVAYVKKTHDSLVATVVDQPDSRLSDRVPGKRYNFYFMLHGVVQHELYHAGQIAILKKAQVRSAK
jgi:uncharacterized damage-inducible protein DinB